MKYGRINFTGDRDNLMRDILLDSERRFAFRHAVSMMRGGDFIAAALQDSRDRMLLALIGAQSFNEAASARSRK